MCRNSPNYNIRTKRDTQKNIKENLNVDNGALNSDFFKARIEQADIGRLLRRSLLLHSLAKLNPKINVLAWA